MRLLLRSRNMKKILIVVALIFIFVMGIQAQTVCKRQLEKTGGFSYCPPVIWIQSEKNDNDMSAKFEVPPESKFWRSNMNITEAVIAMPLAEFITAGIKLALESVPEEDKSIKSMRLLSRSVFNTTSGLKGEKIVYQIEHEDLIRTIQFSFDGPKNRKIIVTYTIAESEKLDLEKIVEESAKTFQIEK